MGISCGYFLKFSLLFVSSSFGTYLVIGVMFLRFHFHRSDNHFCFAVKHSAFPLPLQPFSSGRQVVVERHGREQGMRKEWHGGSSSQGGGFSDNRRMGDSRSAMMPPSRYAA